MFEPGDQSALTDCWKTGFLHSTTHQYKNLYTFATPLHRWFVEYMLSKWVPSTAFITEQDLFTFANNVIRNFSSQRLSSPRTIGASDIQRPPEAKFQDEFYRCCHISSHGSLITFPEFRNENGSMELYIPLAEWGVELLRDGKGLENHSSRFKGHGAYAGMNIKDYIILDFRTTQPEKEYSGQ
jgi:hypothetical protein